MKVRLKLFASLKDICGYSEDIRDFPADCTLNEIFQLLKQEFPGLSCFDPVLLMALNGEYCRGDSKVKEGDTVAFFPPVSGG